MVSLEMDTRRLLLGDWSPLVRDGIDVLRIFLLLCAAVAFAMGDFGAGGLLAALGALTLVARLVQLPRLYDLAFTLAMAMQGLGEALGAYDRWGWFDTAVHVALPFLVAPVIYIGLARLEVVPDPQERSGAARDAGLVVVTFALGLAVGALWEMAEWSSDAVLGTRLQESNTDTVRDLGADAVGALLGAALLALWTRYSWGSVRRISGENRYEDSHA
jgi:hypothetical protein